MLQMQLIMDRLNVGFEMLNRFKIIMIKVLREMYVNFDYHFVNY